MRSRRTTEHSGIAGRRAATRPACAVAQPLLSRIVNRVAALHPSLFARFGPYAATDYLIDPVELPFAIYLRPHPGALVFCAVPRNALPAAGAAIRGRFLLLLQLLDSDEDGDSALFSRGLEISGITEAVVRIRNALDDIEGSAAEEAAAMPSGRAILARLMRIYPVHGQT